LTLVLTGAVLYAAGLVRLRRNGIRWPLPRTLAWFTGLAIVLIATCSGLGRYSMVLFSAHMVQHMALSTLAPIMLLLGAPVTLALRALPADRTTAGKSLRELLIAVLHSKVMRVLAHPLVALAMFIVSLYGFYFSSLFEASMRNHVVHSLTMAHFVATGLLYLWPIISVDPGPHRLHPVMRFILMLVVMPFHAFFGIGFMMSNGVFAQDWYAPLGRDWGASLLHDQQVGGGLAWSFGEIATLLVMLALAYQWARGDMRDARRLDRQADRAVEHGEIDELAAYNAYLAGLAARTSKAAPPRPQTKMTILCERGQESERKAQRGRRLQHAYGDAGMRPPPRRAFGVAR
jgi:cytochrome c oxidase assembly factor CtaG